MRALRGVSAIFEPRSTTERPDGLGGLEGTRSKVTLGSYGHMRSQQQDDDDLLDGTDLPTFKVAWPPSRAAGVVATRFFISEAIVMNAVSTLVADLADVFCTESREEKVKVDESQ